MGIGSEQLLTLADIARRLPPSHTGRQVNPTTVWRWATRGVKLPDRSVLRLEALRIGGRYVTSAEALDRFIARQTEAHAPQSGPGVAPRPVGRRHRTRPLPSGN